MNRRGEKKAEGKGMEGKDREREGGGKGKGGEKRKDTFVRYCEIPEQELPH